MKKEDYYSQINDFAIKLHNKAIDCKRIKLIGDYDADGICSCLILNPWFEYTLDNPDIEVIIPDRYTDGYGIPDIDKLNLQEGDLVVTVDNGIEQTEKIDKIYEITGNPVYVIDHHNYDKDKVSKNCEYLDFHDNAINECPDYCGTGLAYALTKFSPCEYPEKLQNKFDILACIGTVADCVKVKNSLDCNRQIILNGFKKIREATDINTDIRLYNFLEGCDVLGKKYVTTEMIGFSVSPKINALGRLQINGGQKVFDSLNSGTKEDIAYLFEINKERKAITDKLYSSKEFEEMIDYTKPNVLFIPEISEGICGLVASRVVELTNMPCLVFTEKETEKGRLVGSGRNKEGYKSLYECLKNIDIDSFKYGGHEMACGFSMNISDADELIKQFKTEKSNETVKIHNYIENIHITADQLYALEPFGSDNPVPEVNMTLTVDNYKNMGTASEDMIKAFPKLAKLKNPKNLFMASFINDDVKFKTFSLGDKFSKGETISLKGTIGINEWNGKGSVEINISEIENHSRTMNLELETDMDETRVG